MGLAMWSTLLTMVTLCRHRRRFASSSTATTDATSTTTVLSTSHWL